MESTVIGLGALLLVLGMWWKLDHDRKKQHNRDVVLSRLDRRLAPILHKCVDEALSRHVHTMASQTLDTLLRDHPELMQALERRVTATLREKFAKLQACDKECTPQ